MTLTLQSCERVDPTARVIRAAQRWEAAWGGDDSGACAERIAIEGMVR